MRTLGLAFFFKNQAVLVFVGIQFEYICGNPKDIFKLNPRKDLL